MRNCLWGDALKLYRDQSQRYGIVSWSRISSAKWPSKPKKHYTGLINQSFNQSIYHRCVFVCSGILNTHTHAHTHTIYGSQPDTKSRCRSLSGLIDRYHNFANIFSISKIFLTLQIVSFMAFDNIVAFCMMMVYVFGMLKWPLS